MGKVRRDDGLLTEGLSLAVREMMADLTDSARRLTKRPAADRLQNLQSAVQGIDAPVVHRPPPHERHRADWTDFTSGMRESLDERTVRFLSWVPEIATDMRFLGYVETSGIELGPRSLVGLVRSCHAMWESIPSGSPSPGIIRGLIDRYQGTDRILQKWRGHSDMLLTGEGPGVMAAMLLRSGKGLASFIREWRIESRSPFVRRVVEIAAAACRNRLGQPSRNLLVLLFRDLLPWPGWEPSRFKREIGALILHRPVDPRAREMIQRFVLNFEGLGDPRLPANRVGWAEVSEKARDRMIHWLRQANPYVLPEQVHQQGVGWVWMQRPSLRDPLTFADESLR